MDEFIRKYPWVLTLKNTIIGLAIIAGLAYFIMISTREAKKDLSDIFSEEKSEITLVEKVLATGYDFETKKEKGENTQFFGRVWELESGIVEQGEEGKESVAKEIKILRVYKENELNLLGVGDQAVHNKNREELKMYGNVHVVSEDDSTTLDTETLIWRDTNKEMSCPDPVDIWVDDNHILADMMFSDKDMERIDFLGRVSMYIVGIERENFITKEGWVDYEDVKQEGERDPDDVINVECEYVHYDKVEKYMECYPYIPHFIKKKYYFYLTREDFQPQVAFKFEPGFAEEEGLLSETATKTGLEGFEDVFEKQDEIKAKTDSEENEKSEGSPVTKETDSPLDESKPDSSASEEESQKEIPRRYASPDAEPFPGMFPERLNTQVYCWKQNKKIFSNRLDINLKKKMLKPRFDVYIWAFDLKKEIQKKHDKEDEEPSKTMKAIAKETTEVFGDFMNVFWKTDFIDGWGGVEIRQKDKYFTSENMVYSDILGIMEADGDVFMEQLDGEWLEREGLLEDMTDEKAKEDAKKPTEIWAQAMISYDEKDYIFMTGNVHVKQEEQSIIADEGEFTDEDDMMVLTGRVKYRNKDGERLNTDKLTLYTEENRYIAEGKARVRSLVPEKYEDDLKEIEGEEGSEEENKEEEKPAVENPEPEKEDTESGE